MPNESIGKRLLNVTGSTVGKTLLAIAVPLVGMGAFFAATKASERKARARLDATWEAAKNEPPMSEDAILESRALAYIRQETGKRDAGLDHDSSMLLGRRKP